MAKQKDDALIVVRCPHCKRTGEPDLNETTGHYVCPLCGEQVDAQVFIEKRKRGQR